MTTRAPLRATTMGILDDFTYAQIAPLLMPGEQILGMGYATVWGEKNARGQYIEEPRLGAATDRRLILITTERQGGVIQPLNRGVTEWWFEDILSMKVMGEDQRPLAENMVQDWVQFALVAKPGFGPKLDGGADRITVYGAADVGFGNPASFRRELVPWLLPRVTSGAFPQTAHRASMRQAAVGAQQAAAQAQQAAMVQRNAEQAAKIDAFTKTLPQRLPLVGAGLCVLLALALAYGSFSASEDADRHEHAVEFCKKTAATTKDADEKSRMNSHAVDEQRYADESRTSIVTRAIGSVVFLGGFVGMLFVARRQRRKAAAG